MNMLATIPAGFATASPALARVEPDELEELWRQRQAAIVQGDEAEQRYWKATDAVPAWARPGPREMDHNGERVGRETGWPEIPNPTPSSIVGGVRVIRPDRADLLLELKHHLSLFGRKGGWREYRRSYLKRLGQLRERVAAKELEYEKVGLPRLESAMYAAADAQREIEDRIKALPPSIDTIAAVAIIGIQRESGPSLDDHPLVDVLTHMAGAVRTESLADHLHGICAEYEEKAAA